MALYQQADRRAAALLIEQISRLLNRFFWSQLDSRPHAEDLVQETWIRIHRAPHLPLGRTVAALDVCDRAAHGDRSLPQARGWAIHERQMEVLPEPRAVPAAPPQGYAGHPGHSSGTPRITARGRCNGIW